MESTIDITKYLLHSTIEEVISSDTECSEQVPSLTLMTII